MLGISGLAVNEALSSYQRAFDDGLSDAARALAVSVERDLFDHIRALEILATNPFLDSNEGGGFSELHGFHERAVRAAALIGTPVMLIGSDGTVLLQSSRPFGAALSANENRDNFRQVFATGQSSVSNLTTDETTGTAILPVVVPVERQGAVIAVLDAPMTPERLSRLLARQRLGDRRVGILIDANGVVVARSAQAQAVVGRRAAEWALEGAAGKAEGILTGYSSTVNAQVITAFKRLDAAPGWIVLVGERRAASAYEAQRPFLTIVIGGSVVVLLAFFCAGWIGAGVLRDVRRLEAQAEALTAEKGGTVGAASRLLPRRSADAAVSEFENLRQAMQRADAVLRDREERQMLLVREVDHRAKNALAVVQAVVSLTPEENLDAYKRAVRGRVNSLARTHTTLAKQRFKAADLRALLEAELAVHRKSVSFAGPAFAVAAAAAQPLAMVAHELATNAVKYGALSMPGGTISIAWWLQEGNLYLRWMEHGGPMLAVLPERRGFGSRMIETNIRSQLGGQISIAWKPAFTCDISVPTDRVQGAQSDGIEARASVVG